MKKRTGRLENSLPARVFKSIAFHPNLRSSKIRHCCCFYVVFTHSSPGIFRRTERNARTLSGAGICDVGSPRSIDKHEQETETAGSSLPLSVSFSLPLLHRGVPSIVAPAARPPSRASMAHASRCRHDSTRLDSTRPRLDLVVAREKRRGKMITTATTTKRKRKNDGRREAIEKEQTLRGAQH